MALYGLKQSPRDWFERFSQTMQRCSYKQSQADKTLSSGNLHKSQGKATNLIDKHFNEKLCARLIFTPYIKTREQTSRYFDKGDFK
jgi:hypothetical protein